MTTQESQSNKSVENIESEAYRSVPTVERQSRFWAMNFAAAAAWVGTDSFWIGVSVLLSLFFISCSIEIALAKHRYITKP